MVNWDTVISEARECHTKVAWLDFFEKYQQPISLLNKSKPISDIFKLLSKDSKNLKYPPSLYGTLLTGSLSSWDLELGQKIYNFCKHSSAPDFAIPAAKLHLESGFPQKTRVIVNKALRLKQISTKDKVQLEMLLVSSLAEEGKHKKAIDLLDQLDKSVEQANLNPKNTANIKNQMARMQFFLGRYHEAGKLFHHASDQYLIIEDWEAAAKALFNTAACYHNNGNNLREEGFSYVEKTRKIAEDHNLPGPLSHIESFYGLDAFQHGNFAKAGEHFRRAIKLTPAADNSYRRLHILSILTLTYLITGRFSLAKKIGKETLELAALDESDRQRTRYLSLKAELFWEDGQILQSQKTLEFAITKLKLSGIHTLEELSTYSRYILQSSFLEKEDHSILTFSIDEDLKKNIFNWLELLSAKAQFLLFNNNSSEAKIIYNSILEQAIEASNLYHQALGTLGLIKTKLFLKEIDDECFSLIKKFEDFVKQIGDTPLKTNIKIIHAAIAYNKGNFKLCVKILKEAAKLSKSNFIDRFVLNCWIQTAEGKSSKLNFKWQEKILAYQTRIYFAPSIEVINQNQFLISKNYKVSLEKHPALAELLFFILNKPNFSSSSSELQVEVWKQSLKTQGWQQKIRNSMMRIRGLLPFTLAPFIIQQQNEINLFASAIQISLPKKKEEGRESQVQELLSSNPMTSIELSGKLNISPATTKRTLKKMVEQNSIHATKKGRSIYYQPNN